MSVGWGAALASEHMTTRTARRLQTGGTIDRPQPRFTFTARNRYFGRTGWRNDHFHFHHTDKTRSFYHPLCRFEMGMLEKKTVRIESRSDRWRFVCPRGHRSWEPTNHHFWCATCARTDGADGSFHELRDQKTGELREREHVRLVTPTGPYDRDLDGGDGE